jgi:pimeloyl-ACP methyl ester carboxylesterase
MPGWGESDAVTIDRLDHVGAAVQFLDTLGIDRAAFVGNSMGGQTSLRLAIAHPDRVSHLITIGPPTNLLPLFIHGRDDRVVSCEHSLYLVAAVPDSRLVLLNRCGHCAMIEHAAEFNRLVTDFVANN